ncbi:Hypothetical protein LUCI_1883 [Lucifera butyrica]|uniref:Uncharacterized protein n=1 Tax=Lucifera butyrica TaxID=1351585 RepID=A0A498R6X9_9FIRM|nr:Hypothetical protein LUCI_1883 [Lucifera butyrica]
MAIEHWIFEKDNDPIEIFGSGRRKTRLKIILGVHTVRRIVLS